MKNIWIGSLVGVLLVLGGYWFLVKDYLVFTSDVPLQSGKVQPISEKNGEQEPQDDGRAGQATSAVINIDSGNNFDLDISKQASINFEQKDITHVKCELSSLREQNDIMHVFNDDEYLFSIQPSNKVDIDKVAGFKILQMKVTDKNVYFIVWTVFPEDTIKSRLYVVDRAKNIIVFVSPATEYVDDFWVDEGGAQVFYAVEDKSTEDDYPKKSMDYALLIKAYNLQTDKNQVIGELELPDKYQNSYIEWKKIRFVRGLYNESQLIIEFNIGGGDGGGVMYWQLDTVNNKLQFVGLMPGGGPYSIFSRIDKTGNLEDIVEYTHKKHNQEVDRRERQYQQPNIRCKTPLLRV